MRVFKNTFKIGKYKTSSTIVDSEYKRWWRKHSNGFLHVKRITTSVSDRCLRSAQKQPAGFKTSQLLWIIRAVLRHQLEMLVRDVP